MLKVNNGSTILTKILRLKVWLQLMVLVESNFNGREMLE